MAGFRGCAGCWIGGALGWEARWILSAPARATWPMKMGLMRILLAILAPCLAEEAPFVGEVFARLGDGEDEEDDHEGQDDKHRDERIFHGTHLSIATGGGYVAGCGVKGLLGKRGQGGGSIAMRDVRNTARAPWAPGADAPGPGWVSTCGLSSAGALL
jgi:hypothetical protein